MTYKKMFSYRLKQFFESFPLLDRYILTELFYPFFFSIGIFSSLGVSVGYLSDLSNKVVESNLPLIMAIQVFFLKIPEFIAYALPISVLLATLMTYGRLSNDSEVVALQSCGVGIYRLVIPALILSVLVTGISFIFNELVVPAANYKATAILIESIKEEHPFWQNKDIFYPDYQEVILPSGEKTQQLKNLFYAQQFDGQEMKNLTILEWLDKKLSQIIVSKSAIWNTKEQAWDFSQGTIYQLKADASYSQVIPFEKKQIALSKAPFQLASQSRNPYEMNLQQAWDFMKILRQAGDEKRLLAFEVRTQQKIAFPFVSIVFSIVGAVVGIRPDRMSRSTSFGLCIVIIFSYYLLAFLVGSLGMARILSPILAGWLPNMICLVGGGIVLRRLAN